MSIKSTIREYTLKALRDFLDANATTTNNEPSTSIHLDDLSLDDLRREKIRIEMEERKMLSRLRALEAKKFRLFEEGSRTDSDREQRVFARQIRDKDLQAHNMDRMLQAFSKQMRILTGLIQVKERQRHLQSSGLGDILNGIDLQDLMHYVDQASVDGKFHINKFDDILNAMEEADAMRPALHEDEDVLSILHAMQQAHEAGDTTESIEKQFDDLTQRMQREASSEIPR